MSRVIQSCPAPRNVVTQLWPRTPQQCHGARDVRSRHRRAAQAHISVIGSVITGASACARGGDIRLDPITPVDYNRTAAAKRRNVIGAGLESADSVRCGVDSRGIHHRGTVGTVVASARHHHDPGSGLGFHSSLKRVSRTTF